MNQMDLLRHALDVLEARSIPHMVVGSFASTAYGEARMTNDIDIVVDLAERDIPGFLAGFPEPEF